VQALIVAKTDDVIGSIVSIALAIKDEDVINVFLPQVGDIGIFVSAAELAEAYIYLRPTDPLSTDACSLKVSANLTYPCVVDNT
jgi:hypothetical protein